MNRFWLLVAAAAGWLVVIEFIRGRPQCPNRWSFWLKFLGPLGVIALCVLAALNLPR